MVAVNYFTPNYDPTTRNTKMRSNDRVFTLEQIDDKAPLSSTGLVDRGLFTGKNKLHALRDESSFQMWYFRYEFGVLPEELKDVKFTKFDQAVKFLELYFSKRNIKIKEVID